jgi:hypothetical protein
VRPLALATVVLAIALAGCGLGAGEHTGQVSVVVTRDFGHAPLSGSPVTLDAPGGETAMRALQRTFRVKTRFGGGFVQSIDGLGGRHSGGRPFDWFFYVNGIEAPKGAAATTLHRGDVVWWDRHDWGLAMRIPAVVGAFPEPFRHGHDGRRLPVRLECAPGADAACTTVEQRFADVGVVAGTAGIGSQGGDKLLRVLVGPWPALRRDFDGRLLERGPGASGVYARITPDGRRISVLDPEGHVVRTLFAGTGLIAATASGDAPPTWIVTGTDAAGVALAARNLTADALHDRFAVALADDLPIALPQIGPAQ